MQTNPASVQVRPNDPNTLQPSPVEKTHHQLAPSVRKTVPLQTKLTTQLLMVSTQNTSRSNVNPPRMQDPPGDANNRPPDTIEAMQANTSEVEALRLINQRLIGELEQLTPCRYNAHRIHDKHRKDTTFPLMRGNTFSTFPEVLKLRHSPAEPGDADHKWPLERKATKQHSENTSETKNYATLSKEHESYHGSRGSRTFN